MCITILRTPCAIISWCCVVEYRAGYVIPSHRISHILHFLAPSAKLCSLNIYAFNNVHVYICVCARMFVQYTVFRISARGPSLTLIDRVTLKLSYFNIHVHVCMIIIILILSHKYCVMHGNPVAWKSPAPHAPTSVRYSRPSLASMALSSELVG